MRNRHERTGASDDILSNLDALQDSFKVAPLPVTPALGFTGKPPPIKLLRKVRNHIPESTYKQKNPNVMMLKGDPDMQHTIRTIAYIENRSIVATVRILIGLGLRAYAKLASGLTEEQAADALAEEIAANV